MITRVCCDGHDPCYGTYAPTKRVRGGGNGHGGTIIMYGTDDGGGRGSPTNIHGDGNGFNRFVYSLRKPELPGEWL